MATETPINTFDPDFSPYSETNRNASEERRLAYDPEESVYRDEDGCPVLDGFGQPLG